MGKAIIMGAIFWTLVLVLSGCVHNARTELAMNGTERDTYINHTIRVAYGVSW